MSEDTIPSARDATIGYIGLNASKNTRTYCVTCKDKCPLDNASRIYGDAETDDGTRCDMCGQSFFELSRMCQAEHEEQQSRWRRNHRVEWLDEMGVRTMVRCRVY